MAEMLDIYDESLNRLGSKDREAVHRDGDWHRVFQCWVAYQREGDAYLVMQRRASNKQFFPNILDTAAAGHYTTGETIRDGIREIHEELGIVIQFDQLVPLGQRVGIARYGEFVDHEVADVFLLICDKDIRDYQIEADEVSGLVAFKVADALDYFEGTRQTIPAQSVGYASDQVELVHADFIKTIDSYLEKMLLLVSLYFRGERFLRV